MKLRVKGDSVRLRVTPSELAHLMEKGRIEETIHFGQDADARLTYALEHRAARALAVRHEGGSGEGTSVTVILPTASAQAWAQGDAVGVYGRVAVATGWLEIAIEKDWACLDKSDSGGSDTFPNPKQGANC